MRTVYLTSSMLLRNATESKNATKVLTSYADIASANGKLGKMSFFDASSDELPDEIKTLLNDCAKADALVITQRTNKLTDKVQNDAFIQRKGFRDIPVRLWNEKTVVAAQTVTGKDLENIVFGVAKQDGEIVYDTKLGDTSLVKVPRIYANTIAVQNA